MRTALLWVITQRVVVVIPYRRFGTTYRYLFNGQEMKMELIICPESSVKNYQYSLLNNPEKLVLKPLCGSISFEDQISYQKC